VTRAQRAGSVAVPVRFVPGDRVWLDVRGRLVPAVVTGSRGDRVWLRVLRAGRWDAARVVRGRARAQARALCRRESLQPVDGRLQR